MTKSWFLRIKVLLITFTLLTATVFGSINVTASTAYTGMRDISALDLVKDMKLGWNLGNTMDAFDGETSWGNPMTTKAMIDEVKKAGFNTLRIPITWYKHIGAAPNYTINSDWLNRVEQIVNYAMDNNMYVIINLHHESNSWLIPKYANQSDNINEITKLWAQISDRFKNYSDYLIFETLNEPRLVGDPTEWSGGTAEARDVINKYNLAAVNTIRNSGGNNAKRFIMVPTYAAAAMPTCVDSLVIPNNDNRVIVSLHMYSPYTYCGDINGTSYWGSDSDKSNLDGELDAVYNKFVRNGRAVVIGEFGSINKNNLSSRVVHAEYFVKAAKTRGMPVIWWDNNQFTGGKAESFGIFNRSSLTWVFPEIVKALVNGAGISTTTIYGDVNSDKNVDALDLAQMKMYLLDKRTQIDLKASDVTGDGAVDALDFACIKQYLMKIIIKFPAAN